MKKEKIKIGLPENMKLIGTFSLKDRPGRQSVKVNIGKNVKAILIEKIQGANNKIIIVAEKKMIEKIA